MASVTKTQALLLSHPQVLGAYIGTNQSDQLLPRIPKMMVRGDSLQCTDVDVLATAGFISSGGNADDSATTYDTTARQFDLRRIAAKVEVTGDIAQNVSMINDVFEQQIQEKMVSIWNAVGNKLIYGDGTDPDPVGLQTLASENPGGGVDAGSTPLALSMLDALIELVTPWDGGQPRAFVMNKGQYSAFADACHTAGFTPPIGPDPVLGLPVVHYMGIPVLVTDFILNDENTDHSSVYLVHMGPREDEPQFGGLVWFYNEDTGAGIRVDGPHRTSDPEDLLYADLEINIGFATLSTGSVARLENLTTV